MPAWVLPVAAAAASGAMDLIGNKMQQKYNAKEADKNRTFQDEMSSTAYQRAANDLEKAGLNRMLALGTPASTPSGATAAIEAPKLGNAVSTGIAASSATQQIAQSKATEALQREQRNTELMQQHVLKEQANQSSTQSLLNVASARAQNANATKTERFDPIYKLGNEMLEKLTNYGRSAAKELTNVAEKVRATKEFNSIKYTPINRDSKNP